MEQGGISALATSQWRWRCTLGRVKRKQKDIGTNVPTTCSGSILIVTVTDSNRLPDYTLCFDSSLLERPREGPREVAQEGMFWELVPKDVIDTPAELNSADFEREWRRRNHKMEMASKRSWNEFENSRMTVQLREYALREFGKLSWMTDLSAATRVSGTQMFNLKPYSLME